MEQILINLLLLTFFSFCTIFCIKKFVKYLKNYIKGYGVVVFSAVSTSPVDSGSLQLVKPGNSLWIERACLLFMTLIYLVGAGLFFFIFLEIILEISGNLTLRDMLRN